MGRTAFAVSKRLERSRAEQGKGKEKVPDTGPSRPQHARPDQSTDPGEHWIETEKKAEVEGDEWVTGKIGRREV